MNVPFANSKLDAAFLEAAEACGMMQLVMSRLPDHPTPQSSQRRPGRVIRISVQPKTWFGRLVAGTIGAAVMLVAFFLSLLAFAIVASIAVSAIVYFLWAARRARRARRGRTIDGEARGRDVRL